jgi:magnesium transporter
MKIAVAGSRTGYDDGAVREPIPGIEDHVVVPESGAEPAPAAQGVAQARLFGHDAEPQAVDLDALPQLVAVDENFCWIDLTAYAPQDLEGIAKLLSLHRVAVHTALSSWIRPRLDVFKDHFYVTVTVPSPAEEYRLQANQLDLFVGRNFLLSAHRQPLPFAERIMARSDGNPDLVRLDSAYMLYIILDELLAYYEDLNERLQVEVEAMEERALADTSDRFLQDLLRFKRYAFALSQLANQHREIFIAFVRPDFPFVSGDEVDVYFRDLEGRLSRLVDTLFAARDAVNSAFDIYVSHVAHRTNAVMKVLTMVSTVLLPVTVIVALFSTNIQGVPLDQPWDFPLMIAAMVVVSVAILIAFRRKGWF